MSHRELPNRQSIRLQGYDYSSPGFYFITICTQHQEHIFGNVIITIISFVMKHHYFTSVSTLKIILEIGIRIGFILTVDKSLLSNPLFLITLTFRTSSPFLHKEGNSDSDPFQRVLLRGIPKTRDDEAISRFEQRLGDHFAPLVNDFGVLKLFRFT